MVSIVKEISHPGWYMQQFSAVNFKYLKILSRLWQREREEWRMGTAKAISEINFHHSTTMVTSADEEYASNQSSSWVYGLCTFKDWRTDYTKVIREIVFHFHILSNNKQTNGQTGKARYPLIYTFSIITYFSLISLFGWRVHTLPMLLYIYSWFVLILIN